MEVSSNQIYESAKERFDLQDYHGAILLLQDLIAGKRAYADAYNLLGLAYHMIGRSEDALAAFGEALGLNPRYVEARVHRGVVLSALGRSAEAADEFAAAREAAGEPRLGIAGPDAAKIANQHAALGDTYHEVGATDRAIEQYETALQLGPTFHDLRYRLARLLLEAGRSLEARDELEKVVVARPEFLDARAALGLACYVSGDAASASAIWTGLQREYPEDRRAQTYLSMLDRTEGGGPRDRA